MKNANDSKRDAVNAALRAKYPSGTVTRAQLLDYKKRTGDYAVWIRRDPSLRVGRGVYRIPGADYTPATETRTAKRTRKVAETASLLVPRENFVPTPVQPLTSTVTASASASMDAADVNDSAKLQARLRDIATGTSGLAVVPVKRPEFVPFGDYEMIEQVIASRIFYPIFIAGPSGNGKTFGVEQACARTGREYIPVSITTETDEDDLLGGFRLKDGNTVFEFGPAVVAMLRGAVLLLDEVDKAGAKIMCLQSIIDGKPVVLKKLGVTIYPTQGFTVFATANTKGRGDETGKFVTSMLLDEAFLERFPVTVEQEYPSVAVEKKILAKTFESLGYTLTPHALTFFDTLAKWAESIRDTFAQGGIEDLISTRRLVHIVRGYAIFGADDAKALAYGVNRFDPKVKSAMRDLYNKLAPDATAPSNVGDLDGTNVETPAF